MKFNVVVYSSYVVKRYLNRVCNQRLPNLITARIFVGKSELFILLHMLKAVKMNCLLYNNTVVYQGDKDFKKGR